MKNKIQRNVFFVFILIICFFTSISAQTYYVDALIGNNSNTGTSATQPWLTLQKAVSSIAGGSTVIISGGTYFGKVTIPTTCSGTAAKPTIFKSKDGETVLIDGSNVGAQWEGLLSLNQNQYITFSGIKVQNGFWYGFNVVGPTESGRFVE